MNELDFPAIGQKPQFLAKIMGNLLKALLENSIVKEALSIFRNIVPKIKTSF